MKIKSFNYFLITFLTLSILTTASAAAEKLNFSLTPNRLISLELIKPTNPKLPTFLFLPGVNRGLLSDEPSLEILAKEGFGIVTMHFSTQPFSVSELSSDVSPEFLSKSYSLTELGAEVLALLNELKNKYKLQNIIPVSISYSAAVSSMMPGLPLYIDAAPMTAANAVNPQLEAYRLSLKAAELFNPIYGPALTRSLLDQTYYRTWMGPVDSMVTQYSLNADRKPDMIKGYSVLSRAAEGFFWDLKKTAPTSKRIFILGKKDSEVLLRNQLELVSKALDAKADVLVFLVADAGHIIPSDQPDLYANILNFVTTNDVTNTTGIFEVSSTESEPKFYTGDAAKTFIQSVLESL